MGFFSFFRKKRKDQSATEAAKIPKFEEVFTIESRLFINAPADSCLLYTSDAADE